MVDYKTLVSRMFFVTYFMRNGGIIASLCDTT
jgi:hypothetical protein